ncbi:DUF397 domain-containing protein [Streptomyces liangshanensis]|uniref:DUF397 domain-containing protein n=1 Tax=Streptomyces liangshanensis TaxID=2717324 RepID=A0A6G9GZI7_9ACTN|nr:DUF397 domain-containing protein [Streptomyces liangshanensis]QIQ03703.1 DUF397 domain-containing protein [Streptomyces liangshanensis]
MSATPRLTHAVWVKSSFSGTGGNNCLEWAPAHGNVIPVRDSKDPAGPALLLAPAAWATFVAYAARHTV